MKDAETNLDLNEEMLTAFIIKRKNTKTLAEKWKVLKNNWITEKEKQKKYNHKRNSNYRAMLKRKFDDLYKKCHTAGR